MGHTAETRKRAWGKMKKLRMAFLKENNHCIKCGAQENLEIDHIEPSLKISHNVWSWKEERRKIELLKCQILCKKCHQKKTIEDGRNGKLKNWGNIPKPFIHGTLNAYWHKNCRCKKCSGGMNRTCFLQFMRLASVVQHSAPH